MKCPKCRQGDLFEKPFSFSNAFNMPDHCPVCNQNYFPEPGFYYGAMFIGYGITAWTFFFLGAILIFLIGMDFNKAIILIVIFAALTFIYFFRLARSVWIHIYVKYDPKTALQDEPGS
ncbi:DUF983 domain-containing protein [Membranihabitans maritimus]|uniref:DUF983 domain-containing protein n=1 Tax=Membranihabitans maritimus TaxID=2904244 RepID=UPI001F18C9A8|nr:DUF983 domain-containing protein [Membranihabitans maritimus]